MLNGILIILFVVGFIVGLKRGLIMQVFHLVGYILAFIIAKKYYHVLAPHLVLWIPYPDLSGDNTWLSLLESLPLERGFYQAISFVLIFFIAKIVLQMIASMIDFMAQLPIIHSINRILGGLLGFIEVYLIVFIILFILALAPVGFIQSSIQEANLALFMLEKTPVLSKKILDLWFS